MLFAENDSQEPFARSSPKRCLQSKQLEIAMKLVQEFTFNAALKQPLPVGAGPIGTRMYYDVTGGAVIGDRIRGKLLGGGEWALARRST